MHRHADASATVDTPFRVPVRKLALVTGAVCILAQALSRVGAAASGEGYGGRLQGPVGVVVGQGVWNAAQVGLLLLLLCLWNGRRRWWVAALGLVSLIWLPFAIYAISPGAWALTALLLATCAAAWVADAPDLGVSIVEAPARGAPLLAKVEFLALACYLGSSIYNYDLGRGLFPFWAAGFEKLAAAVGFNATPQAVASGMFTLGLSGVSLPPYILPARDNPLASLVFAVIWTVLPVLYILYFAACARLAKGIPGTRVQQALCLFGVVHFVFFTDIVDYQFGRGIVNPAAEWCHWAEVFAWRIAILVPVYQSVVSGFWRKGDGVAGVVLHYVVAAWAVVFFAYMVLIYDAAGFYRFVTGGDVSFVARTFGPFNKALGYPGALVFMMAVNAFILLRMRCKRVVVQRLDA